MGHSGSNARSGPGPDPIAEAVATLAGLAAQSPAVAAQLEADIASAANWPALTVDEQAGIVGRMPQGLGMAQQAISAHVTATGVLPPVAD
jgi:hypothetical protein